MFFLSLGSWGYVLAGEPVPGAEIYIELEPGDEAIVKGETGSKGEFMLTNVRLRQGEKYHLVCKLPGTLDAWRKKAKAVRPNKLFVNFQIKGTARSPITFGSKIGKNLLLFESPTFVSDGGVNSISGVISTSVNHYGINDEGIK
jgi:hypothetical protein